MLCDRVSSLQAELSAAALEAERTAREAAQLKEQEEVTDSVSIYLQLLLQLVVILLTDYDSSITWIKKLVHFADFSSKSFLYNTRNTLKKCK